MFDRFNKEQHQQIIQSIQDFFLEERDEELSEFAAERDEELSEFAAERDEELSEFAAERDEELSEFAAERVLDFIKESIAIHFYNVGIQDAHAAVLNQFSSLDDELLTLERPLSK